MEGTHAWVAAETAQLMTHVALVLLVSSNGAEAEPGSCGGYPWHGGTSPGWGGGGRGSGVAHVLLVMWNFSPFWKVRSSSVLAS